MIEADAVERPRAVAIVLAGLLGFLGGQLIAAGLETVGVSITNYPGGVAALSNTSSPPWWSNACGLVGLWIGFGAAIYYAYFYGNLTSLPQQWRPRPSDVTYVALGILCQLLVDVAYAPFRVKHLNRPVTHLFGAAHGLTFVVLIIMTMFLAPIMEEWLFRGVLFRAMNEGATRMDSRRSLVLAVLISAALFAAAHGEPVQFAGLFFLGVVLALLLWRTKRIVPSVITHMSFNGVAIAALVSQRSGH